MAEKLEWTELSGNGGSEHGLLLTKQLIELQRAANEERPWWHKGACWFVAFCLTNAAAIWWAGELGIIGRNLGNIAVIAVLVLFASFAGAVQSAQSRRG
jgi:hypothetical protein